MIRWTAVRQVLRAASAALFFFGTAMATQAPIEQPTSGPMPMATFVGTYLNPALNSMLGCNSGTSAPTNGPGSAPVLGQCWLNTAASPYQVKIYDGSNFVTVGTLNSATHVFTPNGAITASNSPTVGYVLTGNGTGVTPSWQSPASAPTVATMAALKALSAGAFPIVWLQGYYGIGDGGEGMFVWDGSSTITDDGGTVIQPTGGGTGRWLRDFYIGDRNIRWWGAHCDFNGTSGTDDSTLLQTAINATGTASQSGGPPYSGGTLYWPRGCNEAISHPIYLPYSSTTISGMSDGGGVGNAEPVYTCSAYLSANAGFPATAAMLTVGPLANQYGAGHNALHNANVNGLCFFGNGHADMGLRVASEFGCWIRNLTFWGMSGANAAFRVTTAQNYNGGHALGSDSNVQSCLFQNFNIDISNVTTGQGMTLEAWGADSNVSMNIFDNFRFIINANVALLDNGSDNNTFRKWFVYDNAGTGGHTSMYFQVSQVGPGSYYTNSETFQDLSNGDAIQLGAGVTSMSFLWLDGGNGTPAPTCAPGSHASWMFKSSTSWQSC